MARLTWCALVVAEVAAYASYVHQRDFAQQGGRTRGESYVVALSVDELLL